MTYSKLVKICRGFLLLVGLILIIGCSLKQEAVKFNGDIIPHCADINKEGSNCLFTISNQADANFMMNNSICKKQMDYGVVYCLDAENKVPKECISLDNLNYTTLNISRADFEKLSCSRKVDWINGWCDPIQCKSKNPPVCNFIYAIYCYNEDDPSVQYSKHIWINVTL